MRPKYTLHESGVGGGRFGIWSELLLTLSQALDGGLGVLGT
jgi:hypothetical protein